MTDKHDVQRAYDKARKECQQFGELPDWEDQPITIRFVLIEVYHAGLQSGVSRMFDAIRPGNPKNSEAA